MNKLKPIVTQFVHTCAKMHQDASLQYRTIMYKHHYTLVALWQCYKVHKGH